MFINFRLHINEEFYFDSQLKELVLFQQGPTPEEMETILSKIRKLDGSIGDFNGDTEKALRKLMELKTLMNKAK